MNGTEKLIWEPNGIRLAEYPSCCKHSSWIMHDWESGIMRSLAKKATENGGHILEIGFGMGLSATAVQESNIESHTIIEVHPEIYERALVWAENKKNTQILLGRWQDIIPTLNKKFDGILHDTHIDNLSTFLLTIRNICNERCVVTFFKNFAYQDSFFDKEIIKLTDEEVQNYPYTDNGKLNGIFQSGYYEIKSLYYNYGIFSKVKIVIIN